MRSQYLVYGALGAWSAIMIAVGSSLMVGHWVPLPREVSSDDGVASASDQRWRVFHFLYLDCPCSLRVLSHVRARKPVQGVCERLVLIGSGEHEETAVAGYEYDYVTPEGLVSLYGVESAPMFVVIDPNGTTQYSGGYTSRKQVLDIQDVSILARLRAGEDVEPLPVFGCAVSGRLQSLTDPFSFKYKGP